MLAGHPDLGKSQVTASMAAVVTIGGAWPVDRTRCEKGKVIILSAEDVPEDTIRPRFRAAGADPEAGRNPRRHPRAEH
jgi:RecA-family ATPase